VSGNSAGNAMCHMWLFMWDIDTPALHLTVVSLCRRGHQCVLQIEILVVSTLSLLMQICVVWGVVKAQVDLRVLQELEPPWWGLFLEYSELRMRYDRNLRCMQKDCILNVVT